MRLDDLDDDRCAQCNEPFVPIRVTNIYCSIRCQTKAKYWRSKEPAEECACPWCGGAFTPRLMRQKYCSEQCSHLAYREYTTAGPRRARREALRCESCGGPTRGAARVSARFCVSCRRLHEAAQGRRRWREKRPLDGLRCKRCGCEMPEATRIDTKYCRPCKREVHNARLRAQRRRRRPQSPAEQIAVAMQWAAVAGRYGHHDHTLAGRCHDQRYTPPSN